MGKTLSEMQKEFMEQFKSKSLEELASLCGVEFKTPRALGVMGVMLDKLFLDSVKDAKDFLDIPVSYIGGGVSLKDSTLLIEPFTNSDSEMFHVLYLQGGKPDRLGVISSSAIRKGFVCINRVLTIGDYLQVLENDEAQ